MQSRPKMGSLRNFNIPEFMEKDDSSDIVNTFYKPMIQNSCVYSRISGYFSSLTFFTANEEFVNFFSNSGRMRVICSPELSPEDIAALRIPDTANLSEENALEALLNEPSQSSAAKVLTYLIKEELIDLKIAEVRNGVMHEKIGIAKDIEGEKISFIGSINETYHGWTQGFNNESFDVFKSWENGESNRVQNHESRFEKYWGDAVNGVNVRIPSAAFYQLVDRNAESGKDIFKKYLNDKKSKFPYEPKTFQVDVLENWKKQNRKGIVKFCTGAGKTVVGMLAVKWASENGFPTLIIVPSKTLMYQWKAELKKCFPKTVDIVLAGGNNNTWRNPNEVKGILGKSEYPEVNVLLALTNTAIDKRFLRKVEKVEQLLILSDEVHNLGAKQFSKILEISARYRLGLSATPERYNDPEGTKAIFTFFGNVLDPVIDIPRAIKEQRLVPYQYQFEIVKLTEQEQESWNKLTSEISKMFARLKNSKDNSNEQLKKSIERIQIKRSKIAKKAENKSARVVEIFKKNYKKGQKWLIFVEDGDHLEQIEKQLNQLGYAPMRYEGDMSMEQRDATIDYINNQSGIIISMKCLNEGVDIPSISHAIIVSSSQNPREFVQRRGRVLRKPRDGSKNRAFIWDLVTLPHLENSDTSKSLIISEFKRAIEFASYAENSTICTSIDSHIARYDVSMSEINGQESEE